MATKGMRKFLLSRGYKPCLLYGDELGLACTVSGAKKIFMRYLRGAGYEGRLDLELIESEDDWELKNVVERSALGEMI